MDRIPINLPRGYKFRHSDRLYHVVLSFQDNAREETMYVVKYYGRYKQWWHYEVMSSTTVKDIISREAQP